MSRDQGGIPRWLTAANLLAMAVALAIVVPQQVRASHVPAPTNLCVCFRVSTTAPWLTWQDSSGAAQGYVLQRSTTSDFSSGVVEIRIARNTFDFIDETLQFGRRFYYRIAGVVGTDRGAYNETPTGQPVYAQNGTGTAPSKPTAPDGIRITRETGGLRVSWDNAANNESGLWVERSGDGGTTWEFRASLSLNSTQYLDNDPPPAGAAYRVWTFNSGGLSPSYSVQYLDPYAPSNVPSVGIGSIGVPSNIASVPTIPSVGIGTIPTVPAVTPPTIPSNIATIPSNPATIVPTGLVPSNPATLLPTYLIPSNPQSMVPDANNVGVWFGIRDTTPTNWYVTLWVLPASKASCGLNRTGPCAPPTTPPPNCLGIFIIFCYWTDLDYTR